LRTPTERTEGDSGVGEGVGEISDAPVAAGVTGGMGVSSAPISAGGEGKTNPQKPIKDNKNRLGRCCLIRTLRSLNFGHIYFPQSPQDDRSVRLVSHAVRMRRWIE